MGRPTSSLSKIRETLEIDFEQQIEREESTMSVIRFHG
jgi:hypothetical protein